MRKLFGLVIIASGALAASASANPFATLPTVKRVLAVDSAAKRDCFNKIVTGARGVDATSYTARMSGYVTVRLRGAGRGDWDLALFDRRTRRQVASSAGFGSAEVAQTWIGSGETLLIQACRRKGSGRRARVTIDFTDIEPPKLEGTPSLLRVPFDSGEDLQRLERLGVDVTHHIHDGKADVIVPNSRFLDLLRQSGFTFEVEIADLARHFRRARTADRAYAQRVGESPLPSGRTSYRTYDDYQMELKQIVEQYPEIAKPVVLPKKTFQGREIQGVELGADVRGPDRGQPVFFLMGMHHAREWPSAETVMEFAHLAVQGYESDEQITRLMRTTRIVIVPLVNADGFVSSRGAVDPADLITNQGDGNPLGQGVPDGGLLTLAEAIAPPGGILAYRRKNCNGAIPDGTVPCELQWGIDPNRNYGYNWGGPGSSGEIFSQSYRGPGPWSEPETQAVHEFSQQRQITNVLTIHNVAALVLRPPGVSGEGLAPDEEALKEIGDRMADATGYTSQYGYQLYDTSGTTEDWNYAQQGAFGYTIEMGPKNGEFHMPYETGVVKEWTGHSGREGRGLREAYLTAWEAAADERHHSVLEGRAPAGRVLRLKKSFVTRTKPTCRTEVGLAPLNSEVLHDTVEGLTGQPAPCLDPVGEIEVQDGLETTTQVPPSGRFEWHVTPSTRPFVGAPRQVEAPKLREEIVAEGSGIPGSPPPTAGGDPVSDVEHEFEIDTSDGAEVAEVELSWGLAAEDYDLYLFKVEPDGSRTPVDDSAGTANPERVTLTEPATGRYVARVTNWLGVSNAWTLTVREFGAGIFEPGVREAWTLTCEGTDGTVFDTREVFVDRGERVELALPCGAPATGVLEPPPRPEAPPHPGVEPPAGPQTPAKPQAEQRGAVRGETKANRRAKARRRAKAKRRACMRRAATLKSAQRRRAARKRCTRAYRRTLRRLSGPAASA